MDILPNALLGGGALTALAMYLDAKFSVSQDLAQIRGARKGQEFSKGLFEKHGQDDWSFYHIVHASHAVRATIGSDEALQFEGRSWSYNEFRGEIGRVAEALANAGVTNRTVVCLFMDNSPEFIFTWWALFKLGAIPAPINTKFKAEHIRHCARLCESSYLICTTELWGVIREAYYDCHDSMPGHRQTTIIYDAGTYLSPPESLPESLPEGAVYWEHEKFPPAKPGADDYPKSQRPKIGPTMPVQYLFTSGTTGLPKAVCYPAGYCAMLANYRRWPSMYDIRRRFYICLPMFHGTAQVAAMPAVLMTFGTVILARRFSRREFWADIRKSNANAILYIGEMLRYLVQSPPDPRFPDEKDHHVTLAFGLGLAPTVWKAFRERFGVDWIVEYYSATEATTSLINSTRNNAGNGKVAHWGPLMRRFGQDTFYIVKADLVSGEILRDPKTGFCIPAKTDELGEAICRINPPIQRKHDYVGNGGAEATEKKTLRDVFSKGDEFFRLGDALFMDADGYISFSDRLGDTYRVKGHNISTTEIENCLSRHPDIASVNVYAIPMNQYGYEGQLGCAAIEFHARSWDRADKILGGLEQWIISSEHGIPGYAIPRFLRIIRDGASVAPDQGPSHGSETERVSTIMKKVKVGLRKEGFSPVGCEDQMYWIEKEGAGYVPLVEVTAQSLRTGQFPL